ncbi:rCG35052 [Rattus norvegicus]|uniref:RCG35052 n=1 Tax=Rattus norvegicus TaxID=10116 RepID=A6HI21_RAT|nr:rCG35052 [Rattus norvegicus]
MSSDSEEALHRLRLRSQRKKKCVWHRRQSPPFWRTSTVRHYCSSLLHSQRKAHWREEPTVEPQRC